MGIFEPPDNNCELEKVLLNFGAVKASRVISFLVSDVLYNMNFSTNSSLSTYFHTIVHKLYCCE